MLVYPVNKQVCCRVTLFSTSVCGHVINVMVHRWLFKPSKTPPCKFNRKDIRIPKKSWKGYRDTKYQKIMWPCFEKVYMTSGWKNDCFLNFTKTPCREIQRRRSPNRTWTRQYIIAPEDCKFGGGAAVKYSLGLCVKHCQLPSLKLVSKNLPLKMDGLENDGQSFFGAKGLFSGGKLLTFWNLIYKRSLYKMVIRF